MSFIYFSFFLFVSLITNAFKGHDPAKIIPIFKDINLFTTLRYILGLSMFYALWSWISRSKKGSLSHSEIVYGYDDTAFDFPNFLQVFYYVKKINKEYELENGFEGSEALKEKDVYQYTIAVYNTLKEEYISQNYLPISALKDLLYSQKSTSYREELIQARK